MSHPIRPGEENEPIAAGLSVLRFWSVGGLNDEALQLATKGKAQPTMFAFSDVERRLPIQSLSVWVEAVTPAPQAWQLSGSKPLTRILLHLTSDAIRQVLVTPDQGLDVVWERAVIDQPDGSAIPDTRQGADGHAGVRHLEKGSSGQRRLARFRLAEAAKAELLPEELVAEWADRAEPTGEEPTPKP